MMTVKVRFAPSPTGYLHVGNIRAALVNWLFARGQGGDFILRIDDTDRERSTDDYEAAIRADLSWLGLHWDATFRQSERMARYDEVAAALKKSGLLYPCYDHAEELEIRRKIQLSQGRPPVYDRKALKLTADQIKAYETEGRRPHWRFKLDTSARAEWDDLIRGPVSIDMQSVSDPVIIRADGSYLYTLPSVVDDVDHGITHIVRGEDHVTNSAVQIQLFDAIGGQIPEMAHFAMLSGKGGEALSKRYGSLGIGAYRDDIGLEPMAIVSLLARLGTSQPIQAFLDIEPLISTFDFSAFSRGIAKLDTAELEMLNAKILHETDYEAVADRLDGLSADFWYAVRGNLAKLADVEIWRTIVVGPVVPLVDDDAFAAAALAALPDGPLHAGSWKAWTTALGQATGLKGKRLFAPLRRIITGRDDGPDLSGLLVLIGREKLVRRLSGETV